MKLSIEQAYALVDADNNNRVIGVFLHIEEAGVIKMIGEVAESLFHQEVAKETEETEGTV